MTEKLIKILNDLVDESPYFIPSEFAYCDYSDVGITYVDEQQIGENRWSDVMLTIVKFDGKLFGIEWLRGSTEMQENEVDFYSGTVYEVEEYQIVETKYKKV